MNQKFKIKGKWEGHYSFDPMSYPGLKLSPVPFYIKINWVWFGKFYGIVEEDEENGGMYGIGRIQGVQEEGKVVFVKRMPHFAAADRRGKAQYFEGVSHPPLLYEGNIEEEGQEIKGKWKLSATSLEIEGLMYDYPEANGTFYMKKATK